MARIPNQLDLEVNVRTNVGVVRPGDKIVVAFDSTTTDQQLDEAHEHMSSWLPGIEIYAIRAEGILVYRP